MYRAKPHHRRLWRSRSRPWLSMAPLARRPNPLSHPCWGAREVRLPDQQSELRRTHHEIGRPPPRLRYSVQGLATIRVEAHETSTAIPGSRCPTVAKANEFWFRQGTFWQLERLQSQQIKCPAPGLERVDRSYPSEFLRLSAMDRVKFHLKFRRNFGLCPDTPRKVASPG